MVALARAAVTIDRGAAGEGLDPAARALLPAPARALVDAVEVAQRASPLTMRVVRAASLGVVDHCELRSLEIDAVVREVLETPDDETNGAGPGTAGVAQLVILGAGLDARATRLPELARVRTFEVDHPATQRYKRARASMAAGVRYVAVDFERDSLDARLAEAGHDPKARTLWIWEGTTPYLPHVAVAATLRVIAARSAPGSTLAVTYATPEMTNAPAVLKPIARRLLEALGEPIDGLVARDHFAQMLMDAGFEPVDDTGVDDWIARFAPPHPPRMRLSERLAIARAK
jgi:methyltransferase (TIGR00027 family)